MNFCPYKGKWVFSPPLSSYDRKKTHHEKSKIQKKKDQEILFKDDILGEKKISSFEKKKK